MTPEVLSHLFEPFYTTKPAGRGTGLGLATVHDIVTTSGGCLTVESQQGVGTTVTIYWPTTETAAASAEPALRREPDGYGTETILLAEDDSGIREIVPKMLERYGYTVLAPEVPADVAVIAARPRRRHRPLYYRHRHARRERSRPGAAGRRCPACTSRSFSCRAMSRRRPNTPGP